MKSRKDKKGERKEERMVSFNQTQLQTFCGSLCSIWASYTFGELMHTIVMAVLGTGVSYILSRFLQKKKR